MVRSLAKRTCAELTAIRSTSSTAATTKTYQPTPPSWRSPSRFPVVLGGRRPADRSVQRLALSLLDAAERALLRRILTGGASKQSFPAEIPRSVGGYRQSFGSPFIYREARRV